MKNNNKLQNIAKSAIIELSEEDCKDIYLMLQKRGYIKCKGTMPLKGEAQHGNQRANYM